MSRLHWLVTPLALLGCGDKSNGAGGPQGVDLSGMYLTTHHTYNTSDCSAEGSPASSVSYFRAIGDGSGFSIVRCESADVSSCANDDIAASLSGDLLAAVDTPTADGWSLELAAASTMSGCELSYSTTSVVQSGDELRLEDRLYGQAGDASNCTQAEAERLGATMDCQHFRVLVGTRQ